MYEAHQFQVDSVGQGGQDERLDDLLKIVQASDLSAL
jgi:hypothetical protein